MNADRQSILDQLSEVETRLHSFVILFRGMASEDEEFALTSEGLEAMQTEMLGLSSDVGDVRNALLDCAVLDQGQLRDAINRMAGVADVLQTAMGMPPEPKEPAADNVVPIRPQRPHSSSDGNGGAA